jgi:hypothetical protein
MSYATQRPPIPASWSDIRWIGPIPEAPGGPSEFCPTPFDEETDNDAHAPPGPRPAWGGYRPVRALPRSWGVFAAGTIPSLHADDRNTLPSEGGRLPWGQRDGEYLAHSSETRLLRVLRDGVYEWWVEAPVRISLRAIQICVHRLADIADENWTAQQAPWWDERERLDMEAACRAAAAVAEATTLYGISDEEEAIALLRSTRHGPSVYRDRPLEAYDAVEPEPEPEPVRARGRYTEDED